MPRKKKPKTVSEADEKTLFELFMVGMDIADLAVIFRYSENLIEQSLNKGIQKYRADFEAKSAQRRELERTAQ